MKLFGRKPSSPNALKRPSAKLLFASTAALERVLDGTDETFFPYYFAMYHCTPTEPAGTNSHRQRLRAEYPDKATDVGRFFVLVGEPAFLALTNYFGLLQNAETLPDEFRQYAGRRVAAIAEKHERSRSLGIDLTEGQLCADAELEFLACLALDNMQIIEAPPR